MPNTSTTKPDTTPPSFPRPLDPTNFVVDDLADHDVNALMNNFKSHILTTIYTRTRTPIPPTVPAALADRTVFGRFKYFDADNRQSRDLFNSLVYADLPDISPLTPLTPDATALHRYQRGLVEAITTYFRLVRDFAPLTARVQIAVTQRHDQCRRTGHASQYIAELVRFLFEVVGGDMFNRISAASKLVAGIPVSPGRMREWGSHFVGSSKVEEEIDSIYWSLLLSMVVNTISCERAPVYSSPGFRWNIAVTSKLAFKILSGVNTSVFEIACRMVDIDCYHNVIEGGLALAHPVLGSALLAPYYATVRILYDVAGCVQERKQLEFTESVSEGVFERLLDVDKSIRAEILGMEVKEASIVSMGSYFAKGALAAFMDCDVSMRKTVLVSKHGIMLYFPTEVGPWYEMSLDDGRSERTLSKCVLRVASGEREAAAAAREALEEKTRRLRTDWLAECPVSEEKKKRFGYILNKPGRTLVKRQGIRGNYGRIIAAGLIACGVATTVVDWAGRDNWLEKVFDGAQVASLLAGLTFVVIFFLTGTLTNTLDLLVGVTEAQTIEQVALLTGLTVEELQGVLTYARGTLYWLSEHGASYCPAVRLGNVVMTRALDVNRNPETRASFFATRKDAGGECEAVWIMQGRCTRIESSRTGDEVSRVSEEIGFVQRILRGDTGIFGEIE